MQAGRPRGPGPVTVRQSGSGRMPEHLTIGGGGANQEGCPGQAVRRVAARFAAGRSAAARRPVRPLRYARLDARAGPCCGGTRIFATLGGLKATLSRERNEPVSVPGRPAIGGPGSYPPRAAPELHRNTNSEHHCCIRDVSQRLSIEG
jgi:hypothetical protein